MDVHEVVVETWYVDIQSNNTKKKEKVIPARWSSLQETKKIVWHNGKFQ